jgi:hypothetical protein
MRRGGEIGRHASFRYLWGKPCGGSSPLLGRYYFEIYLCTSRREILPAKWREIEAFQKLNLNKDVAKQSSLFDQDPLK